MLTTKKTEDLVTIADLDTVTGGCLPGHPRAAFRAARLELRAARMERRAEIIHQRWGV